MTYPEPILDHTARAVLESQRAQSRRYLSAHVAEHAKVAANWTAAGDAIAIDVIHELLTERLPPQVVDHRVHYDHPEAVGRSAVTVDARFARWIDHFTATYRSRWWAKLLRLHKRKIEYQFVAVPYIVTAPVSCDHTVRVSILDTWRYPHADPTLRGMGLREPIYYAAGTRTESFAEFARPVGDMPGERWH